MTTMSDELDRTDPLAEGRTDDGGDDEDDEDEGPLKGLSDEDKDRFRAQTVCAEWFGNALRQIVTAPAELETVCYAIASRLMGMHRPDGSALPEGVALVVACAAAVRAQCWPTPPNVQKGRVPVLGLLAKFPLTLDGMFALGVIEAVMKFAEAGCQAQLAFIGHPQGLQEGPDAERVRAEQARWLYLIATFNHAVTSTRDASGIAAMGMAPASDLAMAAASPGAVVPPGVTPSLPPADPPPDATTTAP